MSVTVKRLKELIKDMPDDVVLVMQSDDEGNSYRYLRGIECITEGEDANYFNEDEHECYRGSDLADLDRTPTDDDLQLCAVVY